jgi:hypothetical protein
MSRTAGEPDRVSLRERDYFVSYQKFNFAYDNESELLARVADLVFLIASAWT